MVWSHHKELAFSIPAARQAPDVKQAGDASKAEADRQEPKAVKQAEDARKTKAARQEADQKATELKAKELPQAVATKAEATQQEAEAAKQPEKVHSTGEVTTVPSAIGQGLSQEGSADVSARDILEVHELRLSKAVVHPGEDFTATVLYSVSPRDTGANMIVYIAVGTGAEEPQSLGVVPGNFETSYPVHVSEKMPSGKYTMTISLRFGEITKEISASFIVAGNGASN
jgi:hypothetical protein